MTLARRLLLVALAVWVFPGCSQSQPFRLSSYFKAQPSNDTWPAAHETPEVKKAAAEIAKFYKKSQSQPDPKLAKAAKDAMPTLPNGFGQQAQSPISQRFKNAVGSVKGAFASDEYEPPPLPEDEVSLSFDAGPIRPELHVSAAALLASKNEVVRAEQAYQKALELAPGHREALIGLARLQHRQGKYSEAEKLYRQALDNSPNDAVALNDLGLCLGRVGRTDEAVSVLQAAVQQNPGNAMYRNNIAAVLVEANRDEQAVDMLLDSVGPAVAHYNVGYLLHQKRMMREAASHFSAALDFDPTLQQAREMLAQIQPAGQPVGANATQVARVDQQNRESGFGYSQSTPVTPSNGYNQTPANAGTPYSNPPRFDARQFQSGQYGNPQSPAAQYQDGQYRLPEAQPVRQAHMPTRFPQAAVESQLLESSEPAKTKVIKASYTLPVHDSLETLDIDLSDLEIGASECDSESCESTTELAVDTTPAETLVEIDPSDLELSSIESTKIRMPVLTRQRASETEAEAPLPPTF